MYNIYAYNVYIHVYVHVQAFPSADSDSKSSEHHYWWSQPGNPGNNLAWLEVRSSICCLWAEPSQARWDARDCWADLGAGVKPQLPTVGQGGLSSGLLGLSLFWGTVWVALVLWGRRLLINPHNLVHQVNNKVILNAVELPHKHLENLWWSSMSSQEQDAFQVSSSGPLTIQRDGAQTLMIGIAERSN